MTNLRSLSLNELAETIRNNPCWDEEALAELCARAGMSSEWEAANPDTFEAVAFAAAETLGVEIL